MCLWLQIIKKSLINPMEIGEIIRKSKPISIWEDFSHKTNEDQEGSSNLI